MSKSEMLENVSNLSNIHLWVICLRFSDTHRHTEANHTFFSFLVFTNTCTFILYMMEVSCRFLQNFCNYLYNCSTFIQLVYYCSWLLQIMLAKLDFIYFLLIMEAIRVTSKMVVSVSVVSETALRDIVISNLMWRVSVPLENSVHCACVPI